MGQKDGFMKYNRDLPKKEGAEFQISMMQFIKAIGKRLINCLFQPTTFQSLRVEFAQHLVKVLAF